MREHLFISYAGEDGTLAKWLALRLSAEGYKVWCDQTHLLGGEAYPSDIDHAIKESTFRVLALLSHASVNKPNPRKERTLALSIARERNIDFLIPLNVDGLTPVELDWMTSDLTFIPFQRSWAAGFGQLVKKLKSINAPCSPERGRSNVCDWMAIGAQAAVREEKLHTNLLPVLEVPTCLQKYERPRGIILPRFAAYWPFYHPYESDFVWAFGPPAESLNVPVHAVETVSWQDVIEWDGLKLGDIALAVLRKAMTVRCVSKGLILNPGSNLPHFPDGLLPENHIRFTNYLGNKTYISVVGERTFRSGESRERIKYHLSPSFWVSSGEVGILSARLSTHLHFTRPSGLPLDPAKVISRRKRICKTWWNHQWLSRFVAIVEWLSEGQAEWEILNSEHGAFRISCMPIMLSAEAGIDESLLRTLAVDDEEKETDDTVDDIVIDIGEEDTEVSNE